MIDLSKKCNLYKCAVCLHKEACWNGAFSYNNDFELACPEEIKTRLNEEHYTRSHQKALMLEILKSYSTGEIVMAEKEKESGQLTSEDQLKTYEQGLEDAWEIFKLLDDANRDEWDEIFGKDRDNIAILLHTMSIHEIKSKVDAWNATKNKPKLGDVVEIDDIGEFLFLGEGRKTYYVLDPSDNDGIPHEFVKRHTRKIKKTGKKFDIQWMLDEIR